MTKNIRCRFHYQKLVPRYGSKQDMYIVPAPCKAQPLENGWCREHQYAQAMLDMGAMLRYPRFQVNEGFWVGEGRANWEGMAERCNKKRQEVLCAMKRLFQAAPDVDEMHFQFIREKYAYLAHPGANQNEIIKILLQEEYGDKASIRIR